ncbi:type II toxin-antitoxin system mRNA interferase toxin, RelE/StbE family [Candidatus Magnetomonas plexicatena]|nr:type II toxin-antitoxin system mRNA interferase toxin, RelE/StbE family [Nitrospirales bacterium LBB_01]
MRQASKVTKNSPVMDAKLSKVLKMLRENPFTPSLHTHALSCNFSGKYACSVTHDIRIVFTLTEDSIHLLNIGSHDEIY